jgi:hypothetical protein
VSDAKHHLSLEVTHRDDRAYDVVIHDRAAMQALDDLRQWTARAGSTFFVERGPSDEFRIDIVII